MKPLDYKKFITHTNEKSDNDVTSLFITQTRTKEEIALELILKYRETGFPKEELWPIEIEKEINQDLEKIRSDHWGRLTAFQRKCALTYLNNLL